MSLFKILVRTEADSGGEHVTAIFSPFEVQIDADTIDDLYEPVRKMLINQCIKRKLYTVTSLADTTPGEPGDCYFYMSIDVEREQRMMYSATVRRSVSLPEWIDNRLRDLDADVSGILQRAALDYINKYSSSKIDSVEKLTAAVPKEVLDDYIYKKLCD